NFTHSCSLHPSSSNLSHSSLLLSLYPPTPRPTLFPYTTLFRSPTSARARWGSARPTSSPSLVRSSVANLFPTGCANNDRTSDGRSEEHTSELQSLRHLVCRLLLEKKKKKKKLKSK